MSDQSRLFCSIKLPHRFSLFVVTSIQLLTQMSISNSAFSWSGHKLVQVGSKWIDAEATYQETDADFSKINLEKSNIYPKELLLETILSIIHSYYVDEYRSGPEALFSHLLKEIAIESGADFKFAQGEYSIELGENPEFRVHRSHVETLAGLMESMLYMESWVIKNMPQAVNSIGERLTEKDHSTDYLASLLIMRSLLRSLDSHSDLMLPLEYQELRDGTEGSFGGLGMLVGVRAGMLTVIKPLPESPAERLNIQSKDQIVTIDGQQTFGKSLDELIKVMRGAPGTPVELRILRDKALHIEEYLVHREIVQVPSLESKDLYGTNGPIKYLKIESFSSKTSLEISKIIEQMSSEQQSYTGIILDLRDNPGGLLDQAIKVADIFLKRGLIVSTKGRTIEREHGGKNRIEDSSSPVVVLVNGESASASEIVAGALKDHRRALVVGQPTFGKGSVQTLFELPDNMALKLTIARYRTPGGVPIQGHGIFPDILLQPIYPKIENKNLFGDRRYLKEKFLRNHLQESTDHLNLKQLNPLPNSLNGFYLSQKSFDFFAPEAKDFELECAVEILNSFTSKRKIALKNPVRSTYWLKLAQNDLRYKFGIWGDAVKKYFSQKHHVDFDAGWARQKPMEKPLIYISDEEINKLKNIEPGKKMMVDIKVYNPNFKKLPSVSLYWFSDKNYIPLQEVLFSGIEPQKSKRFSLPLTMPSNWGAKKFNLFLGVNIFGFESYRLNQKIFARMKSVETPDINFDLTFIDGPKSHFKNKIEPNEKGFIQIYLKNTGSRTAKNIEIKLINLSGTQFSFPNQQVETLKNLKSQHSSKLRIPIQAGRKLYNDKAFFGIQVSSSLFNFQKLKQISLNSISNSTEKYSRNAKFEK